MDWVLVKSRMLAAVAYNHDWQQLYLKFRSGDIYCFRAVPVDRHRELLAADSKGKYFREHIGTATRISEFTLRCSPRVDQSTRARTQVRAAAHRVGVS